MNNIAKALYWYPTLFGGCWHMSIFSEKLNYFINNSNIKIAELSRLSGVERSYIQKMITGERMPKKTAPLLWNTLPMH